MKYGSKKEAKKWSMDALRGGLVATIPTPFHDDTMEIHEKDLRSLTRYCIETKNDAIFILGNVGEFYCLTQEERKKVAEIVIDEVQGEIAVIVQTSHHCSRDVIDLSRHAQEAGADLVATLSPYFQCANDQSVEEWWHETFADLEIGAVFYDSPLSHLVTAQTLGRIARELPNIVGVKDGRPIRCGAGKPSERPTTRSGSATARGPLALRDANHEEPGAVLRVAHVPAAGAGQHPDSRLHGSDHGRQVGRGLEEVRRDRAGRQLLNDFFWHNYAGRLRRRLLEVLDADEGRDQRAPGEDAAGQHDPDEEKWLEGRFKLLQEGKHPAARASCSIQAAAGRARAQGDRDLSSEDPPEADA